MKLENAKRAAVLLANMQSALNMLEWIKFRKDENRTEFKINLESASFALPIDSVRLLVLGELQKIEAELEEL